MNPIQEYKVIAHVDQEQHTELVNAAMKDGWQPHGGVALTVYINTLQQETIFFAQAMVKWSDAGVVSAAEPDSEEEEGPTT